MEGLSGFSKKGEAKFNLVQAIAAELARNEATQPMSHNL